MDSGFLRLKPRAVLVCTLIVLWFALIQFAHISAAQQVRLEWDSNPQPNILGYNLYRSEQPNVFSSPINSTLIRTTSFVDATARAGQMYFYVLTAVTDNGLESSPSNQVEAAIPSLFTNRASVVNAPARC